MDCFSQDRNVTNAPWAANNAPPVLLENKPLTYDDDDDDDDEGEEWGSGGWGRLHEGYIRPPRTPAILIPETSSPLPSL